MTDHKPCEQCGAPIISKMSNKRHCSAACKKLTKSAYDKARYSEDPQVHIDRAKAAYWSDPAAKSAYDANYRANMSESIRAARLESGKRYALANPEVKVRSSSRRRATKLGNGKYAVSQADLNRCLNRHGARCAYCRSSFTDASPLEWDHVVPILRGGVDGISNLVPSCRSCNRAKAHRLIMEWRTGRVVDKSRLQAA